MIRVVLTVIIAVALLAASLPALETARVTTTTEQLEAEGDRIKRAVGSTVSGSMAVDSRSLAARTGITVRAPVGFTAASIDRLALVTVDQSTTVLRYQITGGAERSVPVVPSTLTVPVTVAGGTIELRPNGETRLECRFIDDDGPTVEIARTG